MKKRVLHRSSTYSGLEMRLRNTVMVSLLCVLALTLGQTAQAQTPYPVTYYVPLDETNLLDAIADIATAGNDMTTVISVVVLEEGGVVWYDHWEDGYDSGIDNPPYTPNQSSTLLLGDGINSNGNLASLPPGVQCFPVCPNDNAMPAGIVLTFDNTMDADPRGNSPIRYDGKDRISSNRGLAVSRAAWSPDGGGTLLAGAVEVLDTSSYGLTYIAPVGEDTPDDGAFFSSDEFFELTDFFIMAAQDNTSVSVDADGPGGSGPSNFTLNQGESLRVEDVDEGGTVMADKPVQVHLITGDVNATYESRWYTLYPSDFASTMYVTPVSSAGNDNTSVFLYNPGNSAISVTPVTSSGPQTPISIGAMSSERYDMPFNSGAQFNGTGEFTALAVVDSDISGNGNSTHDWGLTLLPENFLTQSFVVGWGPGADDLNNNGVPDDNVSPVWVTPLGATTIYVDNDGDGAAPNTAPNGQQYDQSFSVGALQAIRVYDNNDNDQTGMRVFTADGTKIAGAWGQDPSTAPPGTPALDLGTTVPPALVLEVFKDAVINDNDSDDLLDIAEQVTYRIIIANRSIREATQVTVEDIIPTHLTYISGTTVRKSSIPANNGPVADQGTTDFPFDEGGFNFGIFEGGQIDTFEFQMLAEPTVISTPQVTNNAIINVDGGARVFNVSTDVPVDQTAADLRIEKTVDNANPIPANNVVFTITVTNDGPSTATGVTVQDILPAGLSYQSDNSGGDYNSGTGIWNVGSISASGSQSIQITAQVLTLSAVTNSARVETSNEPDPDSTPGNDDINEDDQDEVTVTPLTQADLSLTKAVDPPANHPLDSNVTFTITVSNDGPVDASGVRVEDILPAGLDFVSASTTQGLYNNGTGIWLVGDVANGDSQTLTIVATVTTLGTKTNYAQVNLSDQPDPDSTPDDDSDGDDDDASVDINPCEIPAIPTDIIRKRDQ